MAKSELITSAAKTSVRVAVYCRYSSKNQSAESAADQLKVIQLAIKRGDLPLHGRIADNLEIQLNDEYIFMDEAKNGRTTVGRDGYEGFLNCIRSGNVNIAIVHNLSRLCRDLGDQLGVYELVKFKQIELLSLSDNLSSEHPQAKQSFIFKGMINEFSNETHAKQTKRGLTARVLEGFSAGDVCYGYRSLPTKTRMRGNQPIPSHFKLEINEDEAKTVRLIFDLRLKGYGIGAIAKELRTRKIPGSVRSQKISGNLCNWSSSCVRKMLRQEKYIGIWAWAKQKNIKNPITKKFERRDQSRSEWVSHFDSDERREELAIIDLKTWEAVQKTFTKRIKVAVEKFEHSKEPAISSSRSELLLAGVLKCGVCGSNMLQVRTGYMGCYGHNLKHDSCTNNRTFKYAKVEAAIVAHLQEVFTNDHNINLAVKLVNKRIKERLSTVPEEMRSLIKDRAATEKTINNIMKFIKDNGEVSATVTTELKESEQRLTYIKERMKSLERTKPDKLLVTPFAIKDKMSKLLELFNTDQVVANSILRKLLPERLSCTSLAENNGKNNNQYTSKWKIEGEIVVESFSGDIAAISDDLKTAIKLGFVI